MPRCPESHAVPENDLVVDVDPLQCVEWSQDPDGRHKGDHHFALPPAMGGEFYWTNDNPLPSE